MGVRDSTIINAATVYRHHRNQPMPFSSRVACTAHKPPLPSPPPSRADSDCCFLVPCFSNMNSGANLLLIHITGVHEKGDLTFYQFLAFCESHYKKGWGLRPPMRVKLRWPDYGRPRTSLSSRTGEIATGAHRTQDVRDDELSPGSSRRSKQICHSRIAIRISCYLLWYCVRCIACLEIRTSKDQFNGLLAEPIWAWTLGPITFGFLCSCWRRPAWVRMGQQSDGSCWFRLYFRCIPPNEP